MFRPSALRVSTQISSNARVSARQVAIPKAFPRRAYATQTPPSATHAPESHISKHGPMYIVLAVILAGGTAGYLYIKPMRDVASATHQAINSAKSGSDGLSGIAGGVAQAVLPAGVFGIYSHLASQDGGLEGYLSKLKDGDLESALEPLKKYGGKDVARIVEKIEKKVKEAGGKPSDIDWKGLVDELKGELGATGSKAVDMVTDRLPSSKDIDAMVEKAKSIGQEQLKGLEDSASKILQQVQQAKKDGKSGTDSFINGLKDVAPADLDSLIKQLKDAGNKAGLPSDTIESWLKAKGEEGKVDAEAMAKQLQDKLRTVSKFIPGEPKDLVKQVEKVSPSLAKLLAEALQQAGLTDKDGNKK
ncbi:hypothetical protein P7C73_g5461, partial [Tremellales sp. Uapishka_1]